MSDEFGIPRLIRPLIGGLVRGTRSRRSGAAGDDGSTIGGPNDRVPSDSLLASLIQDGMLVLPPRYFVGYFLDLLI